MRVLVSVLIAVGCVFAIPAAAIAAEYTVDSTADEPDVLVNGVACLTAGGKCTLRAAIEESNAVATGDTVKFDGSIFEGLTGDTIALGSSLTIKAPLKIDGKFGGAQCNTSAAVKGPCVNSAAPHPALR